MIGPDGSERERFPAGPDGPNGSPVPFDAPSSVRFLGTRLIVANQSYFTGDATHQAILDVEAGEKGLPEYIPPAPAPPAGATQPIHKHRPRHKRKKHRSHRRHHHPR